MQQLALFRILSGCVAMLRCEPYLDRTSDNRYTLPSLFWHTHREGCDSLRQRHAHTISEPAVAPSVAGDRFYDEDVLFSNVLLVIDCVRLCVCVRVFLRLARRFISG